MSGTEPEHWLRGPVAGFGVGVQPVVHSLQQAMEDTEHWVAAATAEELWSNPGGSTSAGFHLYHMANSLDRLMTYARGEALNEEQRRTAREEQAVQPIEPEELLRHVREKIEQAMEQLRTTPDSSLDDIRGVGARKIPASVRAILVHVAEHTTRHVGQAITTIRIVRGLGVAAARD
jgi:uncharacterized damage-inducible protein DinB